MKSTVEHILNRFGWQTVNGKVTYRGFEHLLNTELTDWRVSEPVYVEPDPVLLTPQQEATHNELVEAQKRVDALKAKAKAKK